MINPDRNLYEPPYDDALLYESDLEPERPRSRPLVVLLGIVVLAAFAGVVWVAYNQGVKQGQRGAPPILAAEAGPTRITPDQTTIAQNGDPAPDKSYDRLLGEAPEQEDNILPAPEQPRSVPAPQEVASTEAPSPTDSTGGPLEDRATDLTPPDPRLDSTVGVENLTPEVPTTDTPITSAPAPKLAAAPAKTVAPAAPPPAPAASAAMPTAISPVETVPAPPPAAPKQLVAAAPKPTVAKPAPAPAPVEPPPAAVEVPAETQTAALTAPAETPASAPKASGGVMIQLGSFPNDGLAAGAWSKIKGSNQALLGAYSPQIKAAEIPGKGTWYRLRVGGFADKAAASEVCEQLKAIGQACIIALK